MRVPFRQRNPTMLAILGVAFVAVLLGGAFLIPQAVSYLRSERYTAEFAHAAGLRPGDPVYIAGVPSGTVRAVGLEGTHVRVEFQLSGHRTLGDATTAAVKLLTILGKRYLAIDPRGQGALPPGATIPLERTTVPFTLDDLGRHAAETTEKLDLNRLHRMVAALRRAAPDESLTAQALRGISAASDMLVKYRDRLDKVLNGVQKLTGTLLRQKDTLVTLLGNAELVASTLSRHRDVIRTLVADVSSLSRHLKSFLDTNSELLGPLVKRLDNVVDALVANKKSLGTTLKLLAPTSRYLANATGNGPWIDGNSPSAIVPDNLLCVVGLVQGCR